MACCWPPAAVASMAERRADVLEEVDEETADDILEAIPEPTRRETERLLEYAANVKGGARAGKEDDAWRRGTPEERMAHALVNGIASVAPADVRMAFR